MAVSQHKSKRSSTGAKYHAHRKKRKSELGGTPTFTKVGAQKMKQQRVNSGMVKARLLTAGIANLLDPKTKKFSKAKITAVSDNPGNRHYARRNIITMGAIITTDKGKARVTSRPGQDGVVNAILLSE